MKITEDTLVKFMEMFMDTDIVPVSYLQPTQQIALIRFIEKVWDDGFDIGSPILSDNSILEQKAYQEGYLAGVA